MDWLRKIVVIDCETTGLSAWDDRIVELGIAVFENGRWTHRADYYVNPEGRVLRQEVIDGVLAVRAGVNGHDGG